MTFSHHLFNTLCEMKSARLMSRTAEIQQTIVGLSQGFGFRVLGVGFQVSGFWSRVSGFRFLVAGFGFRVSGFGFLVSGFGYAVSGFGSRVSGMRFRVSGLGFWVSGLGFRVSGLGFGVWDQGGCFDEVVPVALVVALHLPSERDQIAFFHCGDLYRTPPNTDEHQNKLQT